MKKITKRGLLNLVINSELIGVSYTATVTNEDGSIYTFKPNLRTALGEIEFYGTDNDTEVAWTITANPRADAERERDNSMGILFETLDVLQVLEPEGVGLEAMRQPKMSSVDKTLRHDNYRVVVPAVGTVSQMTVSGAKINVVELGGEMQEDGVTSKLQLVFGNEKNLYPLTTYINDNLTVADLGKFLKLLDEGLVSGNIIGAEYSSPKVTSRSINDFASIRGGSIRVALHTEKDTRGKNKHTVVLTDVSITGNTTIKIEPDKVKFEIIPDTKNYVMTITQHGGYSLVLSIK